MISKQQIPNLLTLARMAAVPLLVAAWFAPAPWGLWLPFMIVKLACSTDFLDGYLARRWNVTSDLGRLLDPNADKLLMAASLMLLAMTNPPLASPIAVILILSRELFVSGMREFMAQKNIVIHVSSLAKWKTATQMIAVLVLLFAHASAQPLAALIGSGLLWIAAVLTLITGWGYWRGVWPHLKPS